DAPDDRLQEIRDDGGAVLQLGRRDERREAGDVGQHQETLLRVHLALLEDERPPAGTPEAGRCPATETAAASRCENVARADVMPIAHGGGGCNGSIGGWGRAAGVALVSSTS